MADKKAPVDSISELNRRNRDFYQPAPLPSRDGDGRLVDERFRRSEDEKFQWPDGRRPG